MTPPVGKCDAYLVLVGLFLVMSGDCAREESAKATEEADRVHANASATTSEPQSEWCLELTPSRSEVLLGEPVVVIVALANCSDASHEVRNLLAPEYGLLSVAVAPPNGGDEVAYLPPIRRDGRGVVPTELAPGQSLTAEIPIYYGRDGWLLRQAGVYTIRAEYPIARARVRSAPIRLRVRSPATAFERAAAQAFMDVEAARFFYLGGGDEAGAAALEAIATEYPDTPWARYSRLALLLDEHASALERQRASSCERITDRLDPVVSGLTDPAIAFAGYSVLADCLRSLGRSLEADRVQTRYREAFPVDVPRPWLTERMMRLGGGIPGSPVESFAVYALSRGKGVPPAALEVLQAARAIMERDRNSGLVRSIREGRIGIEGEIRLCVEYVNAPAAAAAYRRIAEIASRVDLVNVELESCQPNSPEEGA